MIFVERKPRDSCYDKFYTAGKREGQRVKKLLLGILVAGLALSGAMPAVNLGGWQPVMVQTAAAKTSQPIHQSIFFNDYQVVGLNSNGWNWVRNDEFILPGGTPLDIDLTQTTYGGTQTLNRKRVLLDGRELTEHTGEIRSAGAKLEWKVPRFSIQPDLLTPGPHQLTFIVEDGTGRSSTVHVRFLVEEYQGVGVYAGTGPTGPMIPSGVTERIKGVKGAKQYYSDETGTWKVMKKNTTQMMKLAFGQKLDTGELEAGNYDVIFDPAAPDTPDWKISLEIGLPPMYLETTESRQPLTYGQRLTANEAPSFMMFSADQPGRWWVNGTNQEELSAKTFNFYIPEMLKGTTVAVYYQPEGATDAEGANMVYVQVAGETNQACDPSTARAKMDILMQDNDQSMYFLEKEDVPSSVTTIDLYQEPLNEIWITTSGQYFKYGSDAYPEEGPGYWLVNNQVVEQTRLNWDQSAMNIASFGKGTHRIRYINKLDPTLQWCASVRIVEERRPIPSSPTCSAGETGQPPALIPIRLVTKKDNLLQDRGTVTVDSRAELSEFSDLTMIANHVVHYGTKKLNRGTKTDRRYVFLPDLRWEVGETGFGERRHYSGGLIFSKNTVKVIYNDREVLKRIVPKNSEVTDGEETLDLQQIIRKNEYKPGKYTIEIEQELSYVKCLIEFRLGTYDKDVSVDKRTQTFTTTVIVQ